MQHRHKSFGIALVVIASCGLAQCGGKKSESAMVTFEIVPSSPIVISADTTVNGNTVAAPWFKFYLKMTNASTEPVTIVAVTATITAPNSTDTTPWAIDPGSLASTVATGTAGGQTSTSCTYTSFGTWAPNETRIFGLPGAGICEFDLVGFYVGGLKPPDPGSSNYRYKIKLKPVGWFGTETAPTGRFDGQITFSTQ